MSATKQKQAVEPSKAEAMMLAERLAKVSLELAEISEGLGWKNEHRADKVSGALEEFDAGYLVKAAVQEVQYDFGDGASPGLLRSDAETLRDVIALVRSKQPGVAS